MLQNSAFRPQQRNLITGFLCQTQTPFYISFSLRTWVERTETPITPSDVITICCRVLQSDSHQFPAIQLFRTLTAVPQWWRWRRWGPFALVFCLLARLVVFSDHESSLVRCTTKTIGFIDLIYELLMCGSERSAQFLHKVSIIYLILYHPKSSKCYVKDHLLHQPLGIC